MEVVNQSALQYSYSLPDGSTSDGKAQSNEVTTEILTYSFTKVKSSNKKFLMEGETALQTVTLTNKSSATIIDPVFKDVLSSGASYVPGSVVVDGVAQPTYDLTAGFPLDNIPSGGSVTISYEIVADQPLTSTPVKNYASLSYTIKDPIQGATNFEENTNTVSLDVISTSIEIVKSVSNAYAVQGDTLRYISVITNTGNTTKTNLQFVDNVPNGTTFVNGSVLVDNASQPTFDPNVGFNLPDLAPGASTKVEFSVTVN